MFKETIKNIFTKISKNITSLLITLLYVVGFILILIPHIKIKDFKLIDINKIEGLLNHLLLYSVGLFLVITNTVFLGMILKHNLSILKIKQQKYNGDSKCIKKGTQK